ncbi:MAG: RIP metalloprotease RseP [Mesonia hippocampi]|uniref:Zinc metalloprotease n=1 Tax=Mesonia hippocampi TaxID=1628250 RepID=A0A840EMS2_9FLAO|nr:RIP metalloprotease RseP [Mesonia hippocampi]MBB4118371.1 regulator of sigma E protease [Mesonia hippocampi]
MSPFAIKAIQLLLSLSFLIVLHELGHFIPAKIFKTRVEKFFLFFDVKFALFKKKIGDTVYGIGWLPLGGYVKISGMIDESMDKEQMAQPPKPWEFRSKPAWQRLIIMLGGVTVNLILGFLIYAMVLFVWGTGYISKEAIPEGFSVHESFHQYGFKDGDIVLETNGEELENMRAVNQHLLVRGVETMKVRHQDGTEEVLSLPEDIGHTMFQSGVLEPFAIKVLAKVDSILPDSPAQKAGLIKGDKIVAAEGKKVEYLDQLRKELKGKDQVTLMVQRNNEIKQLQVAPNEKGSVGFMSFDTPKISVKEYGFGESIVKGFDFAYWTLHDYVAQFKYVFTKKGATQVGGFGAIGNLFPSVWDWQSFWMTTALISIILAFMNILPIPALDGGHVMFLLYEMITGRKPNDKFMEYAQMIGFFILIALVLYANGNDVYRWLFG